MQVVGTWSSGGSFGDPQYPGCVKNKHGNPTPTMPSPQQTTQNAFPSEVLATHTLVGLVCQVLSVTLRSSRANILLPFVALGIIAGALDWSSPAVFTLNFLAIFPLASLLSFSTDELSARVGQTFGGLLNATMGNAVELIVSYLKFTAFSFPPC